MQNQADNSDYSFEPSLQRARFLDARMHLELANSINHLKENIENQLGEFIPSLDLLIKKLKGGKRIMDFPYFSRHLIMSKMKWRGLYETHQIYGRI